MLLPSKLLLTMLLLSADAAEDPIKSTKLMTVRPKSGLAASLSS